MLIPVVGTKVAQCHDLDKLQEHTAKLARLLDDRHPGLFTWCSAVALQMEAISAIYRGNS